nr:glycosyltransferase [Rhabdothermincola salaria]
MVLWNHRWEYDKAPEDFFAALHALADQGVAFEVAVAGESFRVVPPAFAEARDRLGPRIVHFGTADRAGYVDLIGRADVVVSTARHEFFGIAVVEAMAAGASAVLPRRLAYPELVPTPEPYLYDDEDDLVRSLRTALTDHEGRRAAAGAARAHVARFAWPTVAATYDALVDQLSETPGPTT